MDSYQLLDEHKACAICSTKIKDRKELIAHLRSHKLTQEKYFTTNFPRTDKYSGSPLKYKDYQKYFTIDFLSRANLKKWVKKYPIEAKEYFKNKFNVVYPLNQVTLELSFMPSLHDCVDLYGENKLPFKTKCLDQKYQYPTTNELVLIDTREKQPLKIDNSRLIKLDVGDYALANKLCYIERKSFSDFVSTITAKNDRFAREIERAKNKPFVILCEFPIEDVISVGRHRYSQISAEYLIVCIKKLLTTYSNVQILFVDDRNEAKRVLRKLLACGPYLQNRDLQYDYNLGKI